MKRLTILTVMLLLLSTMVYGQWETHEKKNLIEGTTSTILTNEAMTHEGALRYPTLIIRGMDDVYIVWGGYNLDRDLKRMLLKIDDNEPVKVPIYLSTDNTSTFLEEEFIEDIMNARSIVALVYKATGGQMVAMWDVSGLSEEIAQVQ